MKMSEFEFESPDPEQPEEGEQPFTRQRICRNCQFYFEGPEEYEGQCRRNAPKPPLIAICKEHPEFLDKKFMATWAWVGWDSHCGEFERLELPLDI